MAADEARLSQINTFWHDVWSAQQPQRRTTVLSAQWSLLERYGGAVGRYLLGRQRGREITAPACRKALQRSREKFAEILLDELRASLPDPGPDAVREELMQLGLYEHCRPILERAGET